MTYPYCDDFVFVAIQRNLYAQTLRFVPKSSEGEASSKEQLVAALVNKNFKNKENSKGCWNRHFNN